jgi:hypothetical protein
MRNIQFDISKILQNINEIKEENKKILFENLKKKMNLEKSLKDSFWGTYKKWTTSNVDIDINDHFIQPKIRDKWRRVCEYYNEVCL